MQAVWQQPAFTWNGGTQCAVCIIGAWKSGIAKTRFLLCKAATQAAAPPIRWAIKQALRTVGEESQDKFSRRAGG